MINKEFVCTKHTVLKSIFSPIIGFVGGFSFHNMDFDSKMNQI